MLHLTVSPTTQTLMKLTATQDEKPFFFFEETGQGNTEIWVSFLDRLVPSHPHPVPSFLGKNSAPALHVLKKYNN